MIAVKETTDWGNAKAPNHTYLLDSNNLVAYIKQGDTKPFYFKNPIKGFDKRGRKFVEVKPNPFKVVDTPTESFIIKVQGSKGETYSVNTQEHTCSCPGFTYRGTCKHVTANT